MRRSIVRWTVLCLMLVGGIAPAQGRVTPRQIQAELAKIPPLVKARRYDEIVVIRRRVYNWTRQVYGDRHLYTAGAAFELGRAEMTVGNLGQVEPFLLFALDQFKNARPGQPQAVDAVLVSLGSFYSEVGQIAKAESHYRAALQRMNARRRSQSASVVRFNMATMYRNLGLGQRGYAVRVIDAARAQKLEAEAVAWFRKAHDLLQEELAFVSRLRTGPRDYRRHNREMVLGEVLLDLGDFEGADRLFRSAKAFSDRTDGTDSHGRDLFNLGLSSLALGRRDEAARLFDAAADYARRGLGEVSPKHGAALALQARTAAHRGDWEGAGATMDRCQRLERSYLLRQFPSLTRSQQLSYLFTRSYVEGRHFDLALALGAAHPPLAARSAEWLLNGKAVAHELLSEHAVRARATTGAAARLASDLRAVRARLAGLIPVLGEYKSGSKEHTQVVTEMSKLLKREAELFRELGRAAGPAERPEWITLDDVRRALPKDAVLVEFARFDAPVFPSTGHSAIAGAPRYAAWVIPQRGDVQVVDLGAAAPFEAAITTFCKRLDEDVKALRASIVKAAEKELAAWLKQNPNAAGSQTHEMKVAEIRKAVLARMREAFRARETQLLENYRRLAEPTARLALQPLAPLLAGKRHVVIAPDAHAWMIPWAALPLARGAPFLIRNAAVSLVVSGRDLLATPPDAIERGPALVFGDIDYDAGATRRDQLVASPAAALHNSLREITEIAPHLKKYTGADPVTWRGAAATEKAVKAARNPAVLFLSTHGVFGGVDELLFRPGRSSLLFENPLLRCQLSFAGCNLRRPRATHGDDGRLYGIEVESLDLRGTEMVVLSACQTGLGDVHAGQASAGLRQAFQLAGARSVVATLWSVDDASTTQLTIEMFRLLGEKTARAESLRRAQLAVADTKEFAHPYFWAAFTITQQGPPGS